MRKIIFQNFFSKFFEGGPDPPGYAHARISVKASIASYKLNLVTVSNCSRFLIQFLDDNFVLTAVIRHPIARPLKNVVVNLSLDLFVNMAAILTLRRHLYVMVAK